MITGSPRCDFISSVFFTRSHLGINSAVNFVIRDLAKQKEVAKLEDGLTLIKQRFHQG